jgi:DNA-binding NtrC family response regulator
MSKRKLLLVDDDTRMAPAISTLLGEQYEIVAVGMAKDAIAYLFKNSVHAAIVDIGLPDIDGLDLLKDIKKRRPDLPIVMLTGATDYRLAVESMRRGASDFVQKGTAEFAEELSMRLERAIANQEFIAENRNLQEKAVENSKKFQLIGETPSILKVIDSIQSVRDYDTSILITGEPGTGKENVARLLNEREGRARKFVEVNCAAISRELVESELFGHKKGAFTTAIADRKGKFLAADGGDLFLDEIGELPLEMQSKLLRALESRTVVPVGSETPVPFKARIICATNRDLKKEVALGRFREDLYYRLSAWPIQISPLRDRREDIPLLVTHLLEVLGFTGMRLSKKATEKLKAHDWPGNVRALRNCLERACIQARIDGLTIIEPAFLLLQNVRHVEIPMSSDRSSPFIPLSETDISAQSFAAHMERAEADYLTHGYNLAQQNKKKLADLLGCSRPRLSMRMSNLGIKH